MKRKKIERRHAYFVNVITPRRYEFTNGNRPRIKRITHLPPKVFIRDRNGRLLMISLSQRNLVRLARLAAAAIEHMKPGIPW